MHVLHQGKAGEEAKGSSLGDFQQATDAIGGFSGEIADSSAQAIPAERKAGLVFVIEVRRNDQLARALESEAPADVFEAAANGQRG